MASATWKVGDLVQLKAGGPVMVVNNVPSPGNVWCVWFAGKKHEKALFASETLQAPKKVDGE